MSKLSDELEQAFCAAKLRRTGPRFAVFEFLARRPIHATAEEIFDALNRAHPRASRATVYNSLRSLCQAGLVREVASEGKAARFDANLHRHHHFICERCGAVDDIPWFDLPPGAARGFLAGRNVRNYEVVFRGTCRGCTSPETTGKERV